MRNIVIVGASKGLGNSMIDGLGKKGDTFFLISRTKPMNLDQQASYQKIWIQADLSNLDSIKNISQVIDKTAIDIVIYNAGIWEKTDFEEVTLTEIVSMINVNLTSVILLTQKLIENVRRGQLKKIIFIGSTCGLENEGSDTIIYNATKFGIRGVTHALRAYLRKDLISVSCISPGSIASDIRFAEGTKTALKKYSNERIPVSDIINIINVILDSSIASCIKEVHVPALKDTDV
jgi:short-subunit dehydrogenase